MKLIALALFLSTAAFAPAFGKTHAPLPDSVLAAKTVYVVNQTGNQEASDTAYDQFSKWGRYKVVTAKDSADIIAVFTIFPADARYIVMQIFPQSSTDAAFQTTERWQPLFNGPKSCVADFRKRLEEK
jgi:hypothetical protein